MRIISILIEIQILLSSFIGVPFYIRVKEVIRKGNKIYMQTKIFWAIPGFGKCVVNPI